MVLLETTFWDVVWWILIIFLFAVWFYLLIVVFADLFSRDMSGWAKAAWVIGIIIFPILGILVYLIARPRPSAGISSHIARLPAAFAGESSQTVSNPLR